MGNKPFDPKFKFYNSSTHPIEGQVTVYSLVGEGTFVMSLFEPAVQQRIEMLEEISADQCQKLVTFYGASKNKQFFVNCQARIKDAYEQQSIFYWEFLNYDLNNLMEKERSPLPEFLLMNIVENITIGALTLSKHGVYPEIKPQYIQFNAGKQAKLYWAHILPKNMHRGYFQFFHLGQYNHELYAPEEMYSFKMRNINHKINLGKCVVFSLGLILLGAATGVNMKEIYQFKDFQLFNDRKQRLLKSIEGAYSFEFIEIIKGMVERYPPNRFCYQQILLKIGEMKKLQTYAKDPKQQNMSKVSLRVIPS